jgi:hypothetical protein
MSLTLVSPQVIIVSVPGSYLCFVCDACLFNLLKHSLPELASRLSAYIITVMSAEWKLSPFYIDFHLVSKGLHDANLDEAKGKGEGEEDDTD